MLTRESLASFVILLGKNIKHVISKRNLEWLISVLKPMAKNVLIHALSLSVYEKQTVFRNEGVLNTSNAVLNYKHHIYVL